MKILRLTDVISLTGLGRSSIYKLMAMGDFPMTVPLFNRSVGWVEQEVLEWIQERIDRRDSMTGNCSHQPPGSVHGARAG